MWGMTSAECVKSQNCMKPVLSHIASLCVFRAPTVGSPPCLVAKHTQLYTPTFPSVDTESGKGIMNCVQVDHLGVRGR
jgi:hypothetical protein